MRSTITQADKSLAILRMVAEDGATQGGQFPVDHARAVLDAEDNRTVRETVEAHGNGNPPPGGSA